METEGSLISITVVDFRLLESSGFRPLHPAQFSHQGTGVRGLKDCTQTLRLYSTNSKPTPGLSAKGAYGLNVEQAKTGTVAVANTYIVFLAEVEELADLGGALGTEALGVDDVGKAGDVLLAALGDRDGKDRQIHAGDTTADGLSLALTSAAGTVAGVAVGEEEAGTVGQEDTLLHRETLLVVSTSDLEDVALPLVTEGLGRNLSAHLYIAYRAWSVQNVRNHGFQAQYVWLAPCFVSRL